MPLYLYVCMVIHTYMYITYLTFTLYGYVCMYKWVHTRVYNASEDPSYVWIYVYTTSEVPFVYLYVCMGTCVYIRLHMYITRLWFTLGIHVFIHVCTRLIGVCEIKIALLCINFNQTNLTPKEDIDLGV